MNFNLIKEKYPKAFALYTEKYGLKYFLCRELYLFFDEQGIFIEILKMFNGNYTTPTGFYFYIDDYTRDEYSADTRTLAEEQAFLKAFEILEDKLWNNSF